MEADKSEYDYAWTTLVKWLKPDAVWVNKHTSEKTTIVGFTDRIERYPNTHGGFRNEPELIIHHTANVPPGFIGGYGEDAESFILNWYPNVGRWEVNV